MTRRGGGAEGQRGLSLVEILIVVTILGILAGIVLPHYARVSVRAKGSAMLTDLQMIRQSLQVYQAEHGGQYPTTAQMWGNLTGGTDGSGNPGASFGPYLKGPPRNPFTGGTVCAAGNGADWEYDRNTGAIRGVVPAAIIAELGLPAMDVVAAP